MFIFILSYFSAQILFVGILLVFVMMIFCEE